MKERVLWATRVGAASWEEALITSTPDDAKFEAARQWAVNNGFDRLRESAFCGERPDFAAAVRV